MPTSQAPWAPALRSSNALNCSLRSLSPPASPACLVELCPLRTVSTLALPRITYSVSQQITQIPSPKCLALMFPSTCFHSCRPTPLHATDISCLNRTSFLSGTRLQARPPQGTSFAAARGLPLAFSAACQKRLTGRPVSFAWPRGDLGPLTTPSLFLPCRTPAGSSFFIP